MSAELAALLKLGRAERIQLVEDLWDSIAAENGDAAVSAAKTSELRRRKQRFVAESDGRSWNQVKQRARQHKLSRMKKRAI